VRHTNRHTPPHWKPATVFPSAPIATEMTAPSERFTDRIADTFLLTTFNSR
jgi:hypothetical protein